MTRPMAGNEDQMMRSELSLPDISQGRSIRPINLDLTTNGIKARNIKAPRPSRGKSSNYSSLNKGPRRTQFKEDYVDLEVDLLSIDEN